MRIIGLALLFMAAPAAAADQFDLVCMFGKTEIRYRVDLARKEACKDVCDRVWGVAEVTSGEITLLDTMRDYQTEIPQKIVVNRTTGALKHWIGLGPRALTESATCSPASFSGFPTAKF